MSRRTASLILRSGAKPRVSKDGPEVRSGPAGAGQFPSTSSGQAFEAPSRRLRTTEALAADGLPRLSEVVAAHGLEPRKALGQNFLFDLNLTRKIARAAGPLAGVAVVEIGPGPGGLTRALLSEGAARVIAIERDARALGALAEIAAHWPGRLDIIEGDALRVTAQTLVEKAGGAPVRIVANLPYNIATALLTRWLETEPWPPFYDRLVLMFQREVALRIVATPANRADYGRLAVLAGWRTQARILFDVAPAAFTPPPKVTSSVVELIPRARPEPCDPATLSALTQAAFGQRRKMLRQSLKAFAAARGLDVAALLASAGLEPTMRAEEVAVEELRGAGPGCRRPCPIEHIFQVCWLAGSFPPRPGLTRGLQFQPEREFGENKKKEKESEKSLSFAFFPFLLVFGIRTFQWVMAEKSRKHFLPFPLAQGVASLSLTDRAHVSYSCRRASLRGRSSSAQGNTIS